MKKIDQSYVRFSFFISFFCLFFTENLTGQSQLAFTLPLVPALGEETDDPVDTSGPIKHKSG